MHLAGRAGLFSFLIDMLINFDEQIVIQKMK